MLVLGSCYVNAQAVNTTRFDSLTNAYQANGYHGVVLVAKGDQVLYEKAYGLANFEKKIPHQLTTEFKTESTGKMFTATAILQMVEKGKLKLSQTLQELLPELGIAKADKITVEQLLNHTSGLQSPWDHPQFSFKKDYTKEELVRIIKEVPRAYEEPGGPMFYSNSGYKILGWIIEKISGQPFDEYFKKNIFDVAGMKTIRHLGDTVMPEATGAQPYRVIHSAKYIRMDETLGRKAGTAGGWIAQTKDHYRFMLSLMENKLVSAATLQTMISGNGKAPKNPSYRYYAFGLETYFNTGVPGTLLVGHNGGGAGFSVDAYMDTASKLIVISFTNMYQDSRRIMANYFKMAKGLPVDRVEQLMWVRVYDKVRATGMEYFSAHADSLLKEVNVQPHPGMFGMVGDAIGAGGDEALKLQWLKLGAKYYPEEPMLQLFIGDTYHGMKDKPGAKAAYESMLALAQKRKDARLEKMALEKLKQDL